ncbi:MAG: hypothetical protein R6U96_13475 [Promethearchaeia archaeon]
MKKLSKVLFAGLVILSFFMMFGNSFVVAAEDTQDVNGDNVQKNIQANESVQFRFRERTQIRIRTNATMSANIDCDARQIGNKDFEIDVDSEKDLEMNMTAREEQEELGLQKGNSYQMRNRNRYQYQEGFAVNISTNSTDGLNAKLKLEKTEENQNSKWAYYDESEQEWVTVDTTEEDGYLVAETDHFSTWTLLTPEDNTLIYIGIGIGAAAAVILGITYVIMKRRK